MQNISTVIIPVLSVGPLDYLIPFECEIKAGDMVIIPFRNQKLLGVVLKVKNESDIPLNKLRLIEKKIPFTIEAVNIDFMQWVANYYLFALGNILKMAIPTPVANWFMKDKPHKLLQVRSFFYSKPDFNPEQIDAVVQIEQLLLEKKHNIIIDGVTGSGKTEIYLAAANMALAKDDNAQILIMLPEISLTSQIVDRITSRFGACPYIWHSSITDKQRRENFISILSGEAKIIVGARSALFLPYKNLTMIIVDEEHEQSYKQEEGVTYQARDMAIMRAKLENIPIILASASPSLETVQNIAVGKLNLVTLAGRYNNQAMPKVTVLDMKKNKHKNNYISPVLLEAVKANLAKNQQSLLFLNRKGYAPSMICGDCGFRVSCKSCSTGLVYHKQQKKLKCHQCGYVAGLPKICPHCSKEQSFIPCGPGVERLAEEVAALLPSARVITLTQDDFANHKQAEILLNTITKQECDIIIGTQIIAKGHHFPGLTIVGVIDADSGLLGGDLRSAEKTYQILQQVGGRAGRELDNSQIFIQTYNPEHPLILALASYNRDKFIKEEMRTRQILNMPPFGRLAAIILSSTQEQKLIEFTKELMRIMPNTKQITVLGPAPALLYKLRGKFRYRILLKTQRNIDIQNYINAWLENIKIPGHVFLKIDIDPYHFL